MELRVLQYFLAVTREENISGAAASLHLSQPTLSRQLRDLEEELGKQLFIRSNRKITLTEEGMILKRRAEEILSLVQKTESEISSSDEIISGDITIGGGESDGIRLLLRSAKHLQSEYPDIHFHIISGDQENVLEQLDRGLIDFGVVFGDVDLSKYDYISVDYKDSFGILMRKDDPLAKKEVIQISDILDKPLIVSRQANEMENFAMAFDVDEKRLHITGTYTLLYNGSLMVEEGMGYALGFDKIINTTGNSALTFRPIEKQLENKLTILWKKYQVFAKAPAKYLEKLKEDLQ